VKEMVRVFLLGYLKVILASYVVKKGKIVAPSK
jgi:hypothetical protein